MNTHNKINLIHPNSTPPNKLFIHIGLQAKVSLSLSLSYTLIHEDHILILKTMNEDSNILLSKTVHNEIIETKFLSTK